MLDTNALSAWADGDTALLRVLPKDRRWYLPVVALGEFLFGIRRSRERTKLEGWIGEVKATCALVPVDADTAHHYADVREELRCRAGLVTSGVGEVAERVASRYLGREAGVAYVAAGSDDLLVRLEPGKLRAWDFVDEFQVSR